MHRNFLPQPPLHDCVAAPLLRSAPAPWKRNDKTTEHQTSELTRAGNGKTRWWNRPESNRLNPLFHICPSPWRVGAPPFKGQRHFVFGASREGLVGQAGVEPALLLSGIVRMKDWLIDQHPAVGSLPRRRATPARVDGLSALTALYGNGGISGGRHSPMEGGAGFEPTASCCACGRTSACASRPYLPLPPIGGETVLLAVRSLIQRDILLDMSVHSERDDIRHRHIEAAFHCIG